MQRQFPAGRSRSFCPTPADILMERKQTRCADDKDIYPGFSNLTEGFLIARAINFRQIVIAIIFAHVDELSNLVQRLRNKLLSGIARGQPT